MAGEIQVLEENDTEEIAAVINAAAERYEGAIPDDRYHEPYMPRDELEVEMGKMTFYGYVDDGLLGVIGLQNSKGLTLIRHLYIRPNHQRRGIGTALLEDAMSRESTDEVLVGTWAAATWAIDFYQQHGFELAEDTEELLRKYWDVPERQIEESVVLRYDG